MESTNLLSGVVHGSTIQLDQDAGLPEGQRVTVIVQPEVKRTPGEGLLRAFGAWAEDADEVDEFLAWNRQRRKIGRREIEP
jgi:hypothetical protein